MIKLFDRILSKNENSDVSINDAALIITQDINRLEGELNNDSSNKETQKNLMLKYNQALKLYAKSSSYSEEIDLIFNKIDDLRNVIRKSI